MKLSLAAALIGLGIGVCSYSDAAPGVATDERAAVLARVNDLLDSWREADNSKGDRVLHKEFHLFTLQGEGADRKVAVIDKTELLRESKGIKPGNWDDHLKDVDVRIGSNGLAVVTARYLFDEGGKPTHCGLVAMQLYKEAGEWRIISFSDTHNNLDGRAEAEVCPA